MTVVVEADASGTPVRSVKVILIDGAPLVRRGALTASDVRLAGEDATWAIYEREALDPSAGVWIFADTQMRVGLPPQQRLSDDPQFRRP